jgi:hypothetical protein
VYSTACGAGITCAVTGFTAAFFGTLAMIGMHAQSPPIHAPL